jgi:hypothetical protein
MAEDPRDKDLELIVGVSGTGASAVVFWSELTLKNTGCGLPAGPLGIIGLAEGLSYVTIVCVVAWSLYTKACRSYRIFDKQKTTRPSPSNSLF